jgi:hypothetical protein
MTVSSELGESDGRADATLEFVGVLFVDELKDVLEGMLAVAVEGASLARVGFGRGSAGVGGSGEGGVSASGVVFLENSTGADDWGDSPLLSEAVSDGTGSAALEDRSL